MTRPPTSAAGVLALLDEEDGDLKRHALKSLNPLVPQFWAEISERLTTLYVAQHGAYDVSNINDREALYEADDLPSDARDLAALVVSKVYYYLGEYEEALSFALSAGQAFNAQTRSPNAEEYVETVVCKCTSTMHQDISLRVVA